MVYNIIEKENCAFAKNSFRAKGGIAMKVIEGKKFPNERDLYAAKDLLLKNCAFDGEEDGESALKESSDIKLEECYMNLRYPLWHDERVELDRVTMTDKCRAALWYSNDIIIKKSAMLGIKALRECRNVNISDTKISSPEFGWKCHGVTLAGCDIESQYLFFLATDLKLDKVNFTGKYSFQYVENAEITNSVLDTKDAFWHCKNVTVRDSIVKGEYLAWYSENLTFINCKIMGTQPLCYCKGLKLIDCEMEGTDLSFEYSDVDARVKGGIMSVKNPRAGRIECDYIGKLICTEDRKYPCECEICERSPLDAVNSGCSKDAPCARCN